jgi:hypothetical protein
MGDIVGGQGVGLGGVTPKLGALPGLPCEVCGKQIRGGSAFWCSRRCKDRAYNKTNPVARQHSLPLAPAPEPIPPVQDQRVSPADRPRLKGHNAKVLERLRWGAATNTELALLLGPAAAWRTRVSDVRLWLQRHTGETIVAEERKRGLWMYRIEANR